MDHQFDSSYTELARHVVVTVTVVVIVDTVLSMTT